MPLAAAWSTGHDSAPCLPTPTQPAVLLLCCLLFVPALQWVARDAAGSRLVNRPPFIRHAASAAALAAGLPVAMACCWNGLAVLSAAPFVQGLRFRAQQPGECRASECSLLCDDFARLGLAHVVMDPGVRLAYEIEQLDSLGAAGTAAAAANGGGGGEAGAAAATADDDGGVVAGLGPRLPWQQVAQVSAQLAAAARARAAAAADACRQQQGQQQQDSSAAAWCGTCGGGCGEAVRMVECCDLQPGHAYVNFRRDCRMADRLSPNYTATVLPAAVAT